MMGPLPLPYYGTETARAPAGRWLEVTSAGLLELHLMRREAEERVRGALRAGQDEEETPGASAIHRGTSEERDMCGTRDKTTRFEERMADLLIKELGGHRARPGTDKMGHVKPGRPEPRHHGEDPDRFRPEISTDAGHSLTDKSLTWSEKSESQNMDRVGESWTRTGLVAVTQPSPGGSEPTRNQELNNDSYGRMASVGVQRTGWVRTRSAEQDQHPDDARCGRTKSSERLQRQASLSTLLSELPVLPRSGPGSLPPRFRLGSSGVTSDLLFTKRMTGSSLYAPSSGFFESSDLDSVTSSSSSLCSEASTSTQMSMTSACRVTAIRPWSTDFTAERRKELRRGRGGTRRPKSAGALDIFLLPSICPSRSDTPTYREEDRTLQDSHSALPPLSVIQQRQRVERYICKLALKHRCKPGSSTLPTDHGPPIRRNLDTTLTHVECSPSGPPSPKYPSLSSSVGDMRRTHRGSWGRFFSRVVLRKSSRTAASEMNLELCGRGTENQKGSLLEERPLPRTKSFRDLLSINLFKQSERGLDNVR